VAGAEFKRVLLESVAIATVATVIGILANAASPKGLSLARNYFPPPRPASVEGYQNPAVSTNSPTAAGTPTLGNRIAMRGFVLVDSNFVAEAFQSPNRAMNLTIFVDARDDTHYQKGHIPGAYQLDYYRPGNYLPTVLPPAMIAERIIIYCNGGDCEDSEFAAVLLNEAGVAKEKLHVYGGGFVEWSTNGLPVEIGARDSHQFLQR
jgi:rhodanese-related sulfurtransferase